MQVLCGLQVLFLLFNCQTPAPGASYLLSISAAITFRVVILTPPSIWKCSFFKFIIYQFPGAFNLKLRIFSFPLPG